MGDPLHFSEEMAEAIRGVFREAMAWKRERTDKKTMATTDTDELRRLDAEIAVRLFGWKYGKSTYNNYYFAWNPNNPSERLSLSCDDVTDTVNSADLSKLPWEFFVNAGPSTVNEHPPCYSTDHNAAALVVAEMWKRDNKMRGWFHLHLQDLSCARLLSLHNDRAQGLDCAFFMPWEDPAIICRAALSAILRTALATITPEATNA